MKIGFLLLRDTFLKTMGCLIETSINRGHRVLILYPDGPIQGNKAYQQVTGEKLAAFTRRGVEASPFLLEELGRLKEKYQLDVLVTHEGYYMLNNLLDEIQTARKSGVMVVSLAHFYENVMRLPESLDFFDKTYYLSQFAVDAHFELYRNGDGTADGLKNKHSGRYEAIGSPMFDQLKNIDRKDVRAEFKVPDGKRVVLFFAPAISPETRWRFLMWDEGSKLKRIWRVLKVGKLQDLRDAIFTPTFDQIIEALRKFCDRNHSFLIIKSRAKQDDAITLKEKADLYLSGGEDTYYPVFTSYQLLAIADLCIGVMSMSVAEAVAMRVPVWNIYVPSSELEYPHNPLYPRQKQFYQMVMGKEHEGPFNYPGVITNIDPANVLKWFRKNDLEDAMTDIKAAARYAEKYLGITDEPSSHRILNSLEELAKISAIQV